MSLNPQGDHPGYQQEHISELAAHAAATATEKAVVYVAERKCRLKKVDFYARRAITGADTNTTHLNLLDEATEIANRDLTSGNDHAAGAKHALFAPATPRVLDAGDRLFLEWQKVGNGLDVPELTLVVVTDFEP
jgi:hypothetical protein